MNSKVAVMIIPAHSALNLDPHVNLVIEQIPTYLEFIKPDAETKLSLRTKLSYNNIALYIILFFHKLDQTCLHEKFAD